MKPKPHASQDCHCAACEAWEPKTCCNLTAFPVRVDVPTSLRPPEYVTLGFRDTVHFFARTIIRANGKTEAF